VSEIIEFNGTVKTPEEIDLKGLMPLEKMITHKTLEIWPKIQLTNTGKWTNQLLDSLKELGRENYFLVPPFRLGGKTHNEWLFDLVWMEGKPDFYRFSDNKKLVLWEEIRTIRKMVLACESEFGNYEADIVEDFMKLVYCNADFRLFFYLNREVNKSGNGPSGKIDPVVVCRNCCQMPMNQRYLLIGLPDDKEPKFRINAWVK